MTESDLRLLLVIVVIAVMVICYGFIITSYWANTDFSFWRCDGDAMEMEVAPCTLRDGPA